MARVQTTAEQIAALSPAAAASEAGEDQRDPLVAEPVEHLSGRAFRHIGVVGDSFHVIEAVWAGQVNTS